MDVSRSRRVDTPRPTKQVSLSWRQAGSQVQSTAADASKVNKLVCKLFSRQAAARIHQAAKPNMEPQIHIAKSRTQLLACISYKISRGVTAGCRFGDGTRTVFTRMRGLHAFASDFASVRELHRKINYLSTAFGRRRQRSSLCSLQLLTLASAAAPASDGNRLKISAQTLSVYLFLSFYIVLSSSFLFLSILLSLCSLL